MQLIKIIFLLFFSLFSNAMACCSQANPSSDDQDIASVLKEYEADGTMIISSLDKETLYVYNHKRAEERLSPASTFKIANSIIALEEGVLKDQHEIIKWDGEKRDLDDWNKDQNMKSAFKSSCVWFYQELAKKIGKEKYLQHFDRLNYGNRLVGEEVTTFWLAGGGDLRISPFEQLEFLRKIYQKQLPIAARTYDILQDIMVDEISDNYKIYAKTGAATKNWMGHGWYVGYVTTKNKVWFFVTNISINDKQDLPKRKTITLAVLKKKGII